MTELVSKSRRELFFVLFWKSDQTSQSNWSNHRSAISLVRSCELDHSRSDWLWTGGRTIELDWLSGFGRTGQLLVDQNSGGLFAQHPSLQANYIFHNMANMSRVFISQLEPVSFRCGTSVLVILKENLKTNHCGDLNLRAMAIKMTKRPLNYLPTLYMSG